jgi:hypothetical protein
LEKVPGIDLNSKDTKRKGKTGKKEEKKARKS